MKITNRSSASPWFWVTVGLVVVLAIQSSSREGFQYTSCEPSFSLCPTWLQYPIYAFIAAVILAVLAMIGTFGAQAGLGMMMY